MPSDLGGLQDEWRPRAASDAQNHLVSRPDINDSYTSNPAYKKGSERSYSLLETIQLCICLSGDNRKTQSIPICTIQDDEFDQGIGFGCRKKKERCRLQFRVSSHIRSLLIGSALDQDNASPAFGCCSQLALRSIP